MFGFGASTLIWALGLAAKAFTWRRGQALRLHSLDRASLKP